MGRRRSRTGRGAADETPATKAPALPDGVPSVFVEAQQQGVPAGVHPEGAAVLRSFHELQRLAAAEADTARAPERARPQVAGPVYPWALLDPKQ